jgi:hypothetical protein
MDNKSLEQQLFEIWKAKMQAVENEEPGTPTVPTAYLGQTIEYTNSQGAIRAAVVSGVQGDGRLQLHVFAHAFEQREPMTTMGLLIARDVVYSADSAVRNSWRHVILKP